MSRNRNIVFFVGASLILGGISTSAVAQSNAATRNAHQVFTNPQNSTCPGPKHRKVKTSKGYKWRWVC